ncbi:MAG: hypothetical protein IKB04_06165 [Clostridia bacterium]|nr:hypothetical protein [Clostridia bacterium]
MVDFDENLIKLTELNVLGELPDPFLADDGTRISGIEQWEERRRELYKTAIELQYGTQPPAPEFLTVQPICERLGTEYYITSYRVITGTRKRPVSFIMYVFAPPYDGEHPVVVDGDLCFRYVFDKEFIRTFTDAGIMLVMFARTELADDIRVQGRGSGPLYKTYPEYTFGALGAWAWGYSRCVDALEQLGLANDRCIAFTGHSRGGKTAILAGALDERATIVNPNETCGGGCSCYRLNMKAVTEDGEEVQSEDLAKLYRYHAGFWFGPELEQYVGRETELPFDSHYLKAMIAPRVLFVSEAASDIPANPVGSWMTTMAAREVYDFLEVPQNLYWYFRRGYHEHAIEDVQMLVNVIQHQCGKAPLSEKFYHTPFKRPGLMFSWRNPKEKLR